ncbi:hypothetical protein BJ875DRAFT_492652, partial [Amylocarpus encephaloides]
MAGVPVSIAVVGIGCRFPGGANDPEKLWDLLSEGRDAWSEVPKNRFNSRSFYHPNAGETQGMYNHHGGHFLEQDIAAFDSGFFGIPPFESQAIDPQQRILLEVAYEALENAGIPLESAQGTDTAVYVAVFSQDYAAIQNKDLDDLPKYHITGTGIAIAANRLSYLFDLKGPSVTVDTGCSGSLVAIHQACQSLRTGECSMAMAGGTNLLLSPDFMIPLSHAHILNRDGKCYSFDDRGSGYGRGEGAGIIVMKRLDDAIKAGDHIRGIIRNTGINQDGRTQGITVPSREAQTSLIRTVYTKAGLDPSRTAFVEAHGTGTIVGDAEELATITACFRGESQQAGPLFVGSLKPNIGHLESASGVAGLIKAILMLENGQYPPNLLLNNPKESLKLENMRIKIPRQLEPWTKGALRRVSVNSFGYGGTNAHAILDASILRKQKEDPIKSLNGVNGHAHTSLNGTQPSKAKTNDCQTEENFVTNCVQANQALQVFTLTAKSESSLAKAIKDLHEWILDPPKSTKDLLYGLAHTLVSRRSLMQWRCTFTASSMEEVRLALESKDLRPSRASSNHHTVFVFTGQGSQWFAMGRELLPLPSPFRDSIIRSEKILKKLGSSWSLVDELNMGKLDSRIKESEIAQPMTTALQIALVNLLRSIGVTPEAVIGHSSGEIAAAYTVGALSQQSALRVAYSRGLLQVKSSARGAMLAVGLGEKDVQKYISTLRAGLAVVACANSPSSVTISGDEGAIVELKNALDGHSIFARRLLVDTAYHSHHVQSVAAQYLSDLAGLKSSQATTSIKFFSSVTASEKVSSFDSDYWVANLVSKVRFHEALERLCLNHNVGSSLLSAKEVLVEIGPHSALAGPVRQTIIPLSLAYGFAYLSPLIRKQDAASSFLHFVGSYFEQGCQVDLGAANSLFTSKHKQNVLSNLPPYAWDHSTTYWHESRLSKEHRFREFPYHDLLGVRIPASTDLHPTWRHIVSPTRLPWVRDHVIDGVMVFPASGYICMAIEAITQVISRGERSPGVSRYLLRNVVFLNTLAIPESPQEVEVQLSLTATGQEIDTATFSGEEFCVSSIFADGATVEHCRGFIAVELISSNDEVETRREQDLSYATQKGILENTRKTNARKVDCRTWYANLQSKGNLYGPNFSCLRELLVDDPCTSGTLTVPDVVECMPDKYMQPHLIHPGTLDSMIHAALPLFEEIPGAKSWVTASIDELSISSKIPNTSGTPLSFVTVKVGDDFTSKANISIFQKCLKADSDLVLHMLGAEFKAIGSTEHEKSGEGAGRDMSYQLKWGIDADHIQSSLLELPETETIQAGDLSQEQRIQLLSQAAVIYIRQCVDQIANHKTTHLLGHYQHHFSWMKRFQSTEEYRSLIASVDPEMKEFTLQEAGKLGVEGKMLARVGVNLATILTGALDPLPLMIEDNLLDELYAVDSTTTRCHLQMITYVNHLTFKNPNMRVLEIGGGTGSATLPLFQTLGPDGILPFSKYDFTDVSAGFLERSKARLESWAGYLHFQTYDITRDPVEQGFTKGVYDLIIASNVIHVATSLDNALSRVKSLLKPGGRLVLIETTRDFPYYTACFGVLEGWWGGVHDGRQDGPLISIERWNTALLRNGFSGAEIAVKDYGGAIHRAATLVTRALPQINGTAKNMPTPVKIVLSPSWGSTTPKFVTELSATFCEQGLQVSQGSLPLNIISSDTLYVFIDNSLRPALKTESPELFEQTKTLLVNATRVLWITAQDNTEEIRPLDNADRGIITGVGRVARSENESLELITLDVQDRISSSCQEILDVIKRVALLGFYDLHPVQTKELEYILKDGHLLIPRLIPDIKINYRIKHTAGPLQDEQQLFHQQDRQLKLEIPKLGFLDSIRFVEDDALHGPLREDNIEVKVQAWGVNFKDILVALGRINRSIPMAGEYSGIVTKVGKNFQDQFKIGDRVCGYGGTPFASHIRVNGYLGALIPKKIPLTVASAIPVVFSTAYYALIEVARLERGQSILIHSASGGVGQAAIRIAQQVGAIIFATVGSASKKRVLIDEFGIPEDHIFSSKLRTFKQGIQRWTLGKGVDVVLNSLTGQALQDSWSCIGHFGTFIELGKTDPLSKSMLSMKPFDKHVTFSSVDMLIMHQKRPEKTQQILKKVLSMFDAEIYKSIEPITVMQMSQLEDAFRTMQARKHIGKIVLEADSQTMVLALPRKMDGLLLSPDGTYLIAGGLGKLGLELAHFFIKHGAKYIALCSRKGLSPKKQAELEDRFQLLGATVGTFSCDVTIPSQVQRMVSAISQDMPPIKGLVQATMALKDCVLTKMDLEMFQASMKPKAIGTKILLQTLGTQPLDFCLMLSSVASIVGTLSQANYAAGNAFMDSLANSFNRNRGTHFIALNLALVNEASDTGATVSSTALKALLARQGSILIEMKNLLPVVEYAISTGAKDDGCKQIVMGFDYRSFAESDNVYSLQNPMFSHLLRSKDKEVVKPGPQKRQSIEELIRAAENVEQVETIISQEIGRKVSALVAMKYEEIDLQRKITDYGLDSLVLIELKNWFAHNFQAKIQVAELSESAHIVALTALIIKRSALITDRFSNQPSKNGHVNHADYMRDNTTDSKNKTNGVEQHSSTTLPKQPVPSLDHSLEQYLDAVCSIFTEEEFAEVRAQVDDFGKQGGLGRRLQGRLETLSNDASVENWQEQLFLDHMYLKNRAPLLPWTNFYGVFKLSSYTHSVAERASIISLSAHKFFKLLERGEIGQGDLNDAEQPLDMRNCEWFFNATREPHVGRDQMVKYPGNDHVIAFRRGHVFNIPLRQGDGIVSYQALRDAFQEILDLEQKPASWASVLTADHRDSWAMNRKGLVDISLDNAAWVHAIESSLFTVYLDDASPKDASERGAQFLHANGFNRWADKTVQFAICDNVVSAAIAEHSMLDGYIFRRLNHFVSEAMADFNPNDIPHVDNQSNYVSKPLEGYAFTTTPFLDQHIQRVRAQVQEQTSRYDFASFELTGIGSNFFRGHACPPKSGMQTLIQLACRRHFGYNPVSLETVSLGHFLKGRVDMLHTVRLDMVAFSVAADNMQAAAADLRALFFDAARTHSQNLLRVARGQGFFRHLWSLRWAIREGEEPPLLLKSALWEKSSPFTVVTDCLSSQGLEVGAINAELNSFWIHFDTEETTVRFSIWAPKGQTESFRRLIAKSAEDIQFILSR